MKKYFSLLVLLLTIGTTSIKAWDNNADKRLPQSSRRIVMMGNSITEYWKSHEVNNHHEFFDDNGALCRGIAAQKTPAMADRFTDDVVNLHPLVVVIAGGVNDINAGTDPNEVYQNTLKMVNMATAAGIKPILATINPSGWGKNTVDKYIQYNALIKAYCEQHGYGYANYFDVLKMSDQDYNEMKPEYRGRADHSDHLHPSRAGYLAMESVLIPLIEEAIWNDGVYEAEHAAAKADTLSFGYNAKGKGCFALTITYATGTDTSIELLVNGRKLTVQAPSTGRQTVNLLLRQGYNRLSVIANNVDIDKFEMAPAPGRENKALGFYFPRYSIMGDSYSTYKDWLDTGVEFSGGGYEYPQSKYDLTSVDDTWWKQFEQRSGSQLEQNNSISGTCMSYISLNGSGTTKTVSFVNRVTKMRSADLFIIEGGTNDFSGGRTTYTKATDESINGEKIVGDYMWDGFLEDMPEYRFVRPTVAYLIYYLQYKFPGCTVVFMANDNIPQEGRESFKVICEHYGAIYYEMHDVARTNGHPIKAGMATIADQLSEVLVNYLLEANTPVSELPQYYLYNVGQQKYIKTGGINKTPDMPELVDTREEASLQYITRQSDGTYLIADPDWRKGWGAQGRQTIYISTNGTERTASWGSNITPGWVFRAAATPSDNGLEGAGEQLHMTYTWGDYEPGNYAVNAPAGQTYALYYGLYEQPTDLWNRTARNEVKEAAVYGGLFSTISQYGDNALWQIIPVKGVMPDVVPAEPSGIREITQQHGTKAYFNLQGQRVSPSAKGILIINGKKVITRK